MRDVAQVTRLNPDRRVESLMRFRRRLQDNPKVNPLSDYLLGFLNICLGLIFCLLCRSKKS